MINSALDLSRMPFDDPEVYDMLAGPTPSACSRSSPAPYRAVCAERSRCQMATLPRLQPRQFYDQLLLATAITVPACARRRSWVLSR
jgi:hypothetical protein